MQDIFIFTPPNGMNELSIATVSSESRMETESFPCVRPGFPLERYLAGSCWFSLLPTSQREIAFCLYSEYKSLWSKLMIWLSRRNSLHQQRNTKTLSKLITNPEQIPRHSSVLEKETYGPVGTEPHTCPVQAISYPDSQDAPDALMSPPLIAP